MRKSTRLEHGKEDLRVKNRLVPLVFILSASLLTSCFFDCQDVALADLDGDSDLDAFFANGRYEAFESNTVWLNDGTGRFSGSGQLLGKPIDTHSVALGDLDADGDLDAFVGNGVTCQMFENNGEGWFLAHRWTSTPGDSGAWSWTVALGDVDGDGDLDAFAAGCCGTVAHGENWLYRSSHSDPLPHPRRNPHRPQKRPLQLLHRNPAALLACVRRPLCYLWQP